MYLLSQNLHESTEECQEKSSSGYPVSGKIFEPGTSRIWSRFTNHSTVTFGRIHTALHKPCTLLWYIVILISVIIITVIYSKNCRYIYVVAKRPAITMPMNSKGLILSFTICTYALVTLTTHPHLVPRSWMSRSYTSSPPKRHHGV
jgi:hypothetical protein